MTFILSKDRPENSPGEWNEAWKMYSDYLESIRDRLGKSAYEFAVAPWHYNFEDHRSPHDGRLESLTIQESAESEGLRAQRLVDIKIRLLGAYLDGYIEISYKGVVSYSLAMLSKKESGHGDWLYDEIRLSEDGRCLHEVEWSSGSNWLIESDDIAYKWEPQTSVDS